MLERYRRYKGSGMVGKKSRWGSSRDRRKYRLGQMNMSCNVEWMSMRRIADLYVIMFTGGLVHYFTIGTSQTVGRVTSCAILP